MMNKLKQIEIGGFGRGGSATIEVLNAPQNAPLFKNTQVKVRDLEPGKAETALVRLQASDKFIAQDGSIEDVDFEEVDTIVLNTDQPAVHRNIIQTASQQSQKSSLPRILFYNVMSTRKHPLLGVQGQVNVGEVDEETLYKLLLFLDTMSKGQSIHGSAYVFGTESPFFNRELVPELRKAFQTHALEVIRKDWARQPQKYPVIEVVDSYQAKPLVLLDHHKGWSEQRKELVAAINTELDRQAEQGRVIERNTPLAIAEMGVDGLRFHNGDLDYRGNVHIFEMQDINPVREPKRYHFQQDELQQHQISKRQPIPITD